MEDNKKYIIIGVVAVIIFAIFVAVILSDTDKKGEKNESKSSVNNITNTVKEKNNEENFDYETAAKEQMLPPKTGETIATMHVKNYGDITFKFFEDKAPKAVENFLTHAKDGYYNGVKFHRVMEEFMIQGGDPEGTGRGGESIWGKGFEEEIDQGLVPYRGALCMASTGYGNSSLGSQFFIVQANSNETMANTLSLNGFPEGLVNSYLNYGGYLSLYRKYTVFGQVVEGMDVVDKIAGTAKTMSESGELSQPVEDVIIESIDVNVKE